jgi:glucokinase
MTKKDIGRPILGWDVGGTKSAAVVVSEDGKILHREEWPSNAPAGPEAMWRDFISRAHALLKEYPSITEVGVSIGGPMNPLTGVILSPPHLPGWDEIPLAQMLQRELGLSPTVEHDAIACLQAEWLWGAAKETSHAVYLTCGTGCGAGVLLGGEPLRGPGGQTPEVGHVRLAPDGPEIFGKRGCVESFCSGEGIGKLATYRFPERFLEAPDTRKLHQLAMEGDEQAKAVLEEAARRTGQVCAMLADLFSPEVFVLGTLARHFGAWWMDIIRDEFHREALPANSEHARIVTAALAEKLQDLSAVAPCICRRASLD